MKIDISTAEENQIIIALKERSTNLKKRKYKDEFVERSIETIEKLLLKIERHSKEKAERIMKDEG